MQYNIAGWTLLGIGLAGMIATAFVPEIYSPYIDYYEEGYVQAYYSEHYKEFELYRNKFKSAQISAGVIGAAFALAGMGTLIADYVQFGDRKKVLKEQKAILQNDIQANAENIDVNALLDTTTASSSLHWSPAVSIHPDYSSLGAVIFY